MPETTYRHLLASAKAALDGILKGGQSYSIDGMTFNRANMADLIELINELEGKAWAEANPSSDSGFLIVRTAEPQ